MRPGIAPVSVGNSNPHPLRWIQLTRRDSFVTANTTSSTWAFASEIATATAAALRTFNEDSGVHPITAPHCIRNSSRRLFLRLQLAQDQSRICRSSSAITNRCTEPGRRREAMAASRALISMRFQQSQRRLPHGATARRDRKYRYPFKRTPSLQQQTRDQPPHRQTH